MPHATITEITPRTAFGAALYRLGNLFTAPRGPSFSRRQNIDERRFRPDPEAVPPRGFIALDALPPNLPHTILRHANHRLRRDVKFLVNVSDLPRGAKFVHPDEAALQPQIPVRRHLHRRL